MTGLAPITHSYGIYVSGSGNTITGSTVTDRFYGIRVNGLGNTVTGSAVTDCFYGIVVDGSGNTIYRNNFIDNLTQALAFGSNIFNLDKPVGGNYWSDWTVPDNDADGFVDNPYVFYGGQDNFPWVRQNGWLIDIPDLAVSQIIAPSTAISGQTIHLSWEVGNFGTGTTYVASWHDRVVLSANQRYGDADDVELARLRYTGVLDPGGRYTVETDVRLPKGISGSYYLFVETDDNNRMFEYIFEGNNVGQSSSTILVVKGGVKVQRLAGRNETVTLPRNFWENAWFFTATGAVKATAFSAERKGSVQRYGPMDSDSSASTSRRRQRTTDHA